MKDALKHLKKENGQSLVEFAIVLPMLLLLVCGIIDFGWLFYNQLSLDNCAREAARYGAVNAAKTDCDALIRAKIDETAADSLKESLTASIVFSAPSAPCTGNITVTLKSNIKILTPLLGIFYENQEKEITSSVTMKAES